MAVVIIWSWSKNTVANRLRKIDRSYGNVYITAG